MIWTLKIECVWGMYLEENCIRIMEVDSKSSLFDLHDAIQDAVGFDRDHLFEFFGGRYHRQRKVVFESSFDWQESFDIYDRITLESVYPLPKSCKLFYHFDFGDDWYFAVTLSRKKPKAPEAGVTYPRVIEAIGPNPAQYGEEVEDMEWDGIDEE